EDKNFTRAFFKHIIRPHENIGVDFWWIDWQQWYLAKTESHLSNTFWLNHVFYTDKKLQGKNRPLIYHRWGGLGNHRYQIGFSGDAEASFESLAFQPVFTATASNVLYGYWSHDIGGHWSRGDNNPELYLRWIQYGVFSPILRTHASNWKNLERRIWVYDNFPSILKALRLRYALAPYIYTNAHYAYETGISLCRPLYYDYPEDDKAYEIEDEYMFGNDILVAPVLQSDKGTGTASRKIWLPEGKWYEVATGTELKGNQIVTRSYSREQIPYFYKESAIIPMYPKMNNLKTRPDTLILQFAPGNFGEFSYYEDEEDNDNYQKGDYTLTKITQKREENQIVITIEPREGIFNGMPKNRAYHLEILSLEKTEKVEFIKGEKGNYQYDATRKTLIVELPVQACTQKIELKVVL
ncbi:MAG: DUF5110 domain-containing protein, partial [Bacteroidales bacterium]|nr:DUF5110 domain-containing protein [Bacteroidales bacterium]